MPPPQTKVSVRVPDFDSLKIPFFSYVLIINIL